MTSQEKPRGVVRLYVNLHPEVADALTELAERKGITVTDAVRRAIATWKMISDAQLEGKHILIADGEGKRMTTRELIIL